MAKGHITRRELREDAFHDAGLSAWEYVHSHRRTILGVIVAVLAAVVVIQAGRAVLARRTRDASSLLTDARSRYILACISDKAEREELTDAALRYCQELRDNYPSSQWGAEALYVQGNCHFLRGDFDRALAMFDDYIAGAEDLESQAKGHIAAGFSHENRFFLEPDTQDHLRRATESYERGRDLARQAADGGPSYLASHASLGLARLKTAQGNTRGAARIYEEIESERQALDEPLRVLEGVLSETGADRSEQIELIRQQLRIGMAQFGFESIARTQLDRLRAAQQEDPDPQTTN